MIDLLQFFSPENKFVSCQVGEGVVTQLHRLWEDFLGHKCSFCIHIHSCQRNLTCEICFILLEKSQKIISGISSPQMENLKPCSSFIINHSCIYLSINCLSSYLSVNLSRILISLFIKNSLTPINDKSVEILRNNISPIFKEVHSKF